MKCFRHVEMDAVAICRACSKGICTNCAVDLGHSVTCRGSCQTEASVVHGQILAGRRTFRMQERNRFVLPLWLGASGLVFLFVGLTRESSPLNFMTTLGLIFVISAAVLARINSKWAREITDDGV
jgi:hypothetical protein